jgi:zinc protease
MKMPTLMSRLSSYGASVFLALSLACATTPEAPAPKAEPAAAPAPAAEKPAAPPILETPDSPFRATKPDPLPVKPTFQAPVPVVKKLKNGAELWVVENRALPLVAVEVAFRTGTNAEPIAKAGLTELTVSMLDEGTKTRTATQLAEALEDLAIDLSVGAGREEMHVHLNCLTETLPQGLDLLADVIQHPAFRAEDLDRVRTLKITALQQKKGMPAALASDEMGRIVFGPKHPWGQPDGGTPETLKSITPADLAKFHDTWFRPNNAVIVVSGDVKPDEVAALLEQRLAGWKAKPLPALKLPTWPQLTARAVTFVDKPNTTQSQVWVVGRLFPATHPDAIPLRTANFALGGLFTSRLNMNLREDKGYSYGVFSRLTFSRSFGVMVASGGIVAKNTSEALAEYQKELQRFAEGGLTEEELARSKEAYIRTLPSVLETNDSMSSALAGIATLGLPADYYQTLPQKVAALTAADIARVARHVQPGKWPIIVVGPAAESAEKIKALNLGPVEVKPVAPAGGPSASGK